MPELSELPARDANGALRVVVETPRGSRAKLKYAPDTGAFELSRPLALGLSYPYDWGFVPGTLAPDGDPLDAMVLHDEATYPGVVIACRPVAVVFVTQAAPGKKAHRNDRVLVSPVKNARAPGELRLPPDAKKQLEAFFLAAVLGTGKRVRIDGWGGPRDVERVVAAAERAKPQPPRKRR